MNAIVSPEWDILDEAMSEFIADIVVAKSKHQRHRRNMEYRRRLELMLEEKRLKNKALAITPTNPPQIVSFSIKTPTSKSKPYASNDLFQSDNNK